MWLLPLSLRHWVCETHAIARISAFFPALLSWLVQQIFKGECVPGVPSDWWALSKASGDSLSECLLGAFLKRSSVFISLTPLVGGSQRPPHSWCWLGTCDGPHAKLKILQTLTSVPQGRHPYQSHFTDRETEGQRGRENGTKSQTWQRVVPGSDPMGGLHPKSYVLYKLPASIRIIWNKRLRGPSPEPHGWLGSV